MADLRSLVSEFKREHRARAARMLDEFRRPEHSDDEAVSRAALAQLLSGKRYSHQYRIPAATLRESRCRLIADLAHLRATASFEDLIAHVDDRVGSIRGIGPVTIYDTALKIGARFGHEPSRVYLHAGTRTGARNLGLPARGRTLAMADVPHELRTLRPREIEDFLCIYKDQFGDQPSAKRGGCSPQRPRKTCG